jgi:hypothetical protein
MSEKRNEWNDYYQSRSSPGDKDDNEFYEHRYSSEFCSAGKWVNEDLLKTKFDALQVDGHITFKEAEKLALDANLTVDSTNIQHYLNIHVKPKGEMLFDWRRFFIALTELARVSVQSDIFKKDLERAENEIGHLSGTMALAKLRDFAPDWSEEQLVKFVLAKCRFEETNISPTEYAELMCPLKVWRKSEEFEEVNKDEWK